MPQLRVLLNEWVEQLTVAGVYQPRKEAEVIIAIVLGVDPESLSITHDKTLEGVACERIQQAMVMRAKRIPIPRIFKSMPFCGLTLHVADGVYQPYPESEYFAEHLMMMIETQTQSLRILDVGTGTGCLLLALLKAFPHATGLGVDVSAAALQLATQNAVSNNLAARASFGSSHWGDGIDEQFDLVMCNPPRVATSDLDRLQPELRNHDPVLSLDGGADGMECFRQVALRFVTLTKPNGVCAFQIGPRYHDHVVRILKCNGFETIETKRNYLHEPVGVVASNRREPTGLFRRMAQ